MIIEIQCLPNPTGTENEVYKYVEVAIEKVQNSGLTYEVGALGTTIEGEPNAIWPLIRQIHETCLHSGATSLVTVVKIEQSLRDTTPTIQGLTSKFRS